MGLEVHGLQLPPPRLPGRNHAGLAAGVRVAFPAATSRPSPYIEPMIEGFRVLPEYFPHAAQKALVAEILSILETNPLYRGAMPRTGKPLSVRNTNLGQLGWVSDIKGYRYQPTHTK